MNYRCSAAQGAAATIANVRYRRESSARIHAAGAQRPKLDTLRQCLGATITSMFEAWEPDNAAMLRNKIGISEMQHTQTTGSIPDFFILTPFYPVFWRISHTLYACWLLRLLFSLGFLVCQIAQSLQYSDGNKAATAY